MQRVLAGIWGDDVNRPLIVLPELTVLSRVCLLLRALSGADDGWMGARYLHLTHFLRLLDDWLACPFNRAGKVNQVGNRVDLETILMRSTWLDSLLGQVISGFQN